MYQADPDFNAKRLSALGNQIKRAREEADYAALIARINDVMTTQLATANQFTATLALVPSHSPQTASADCAEKHATIPALFNDGTGALSGLGTKAELQKAIPLKLLTKSWVKL